MDIWSNKSIARDLNDYVTVVKKYDQMYTFDIDKLLEVSRTISDIDHCEIDTIEIEFRLLKPIAKTVPQVNALKINLQNAISTDPTKDISIEDPIKNYKFDMMIVGFIDDGSEPVINCWHLDCDRFYDADGQLVEVKGKQKYTHPLYHFQFGGGGMDGRHSGDILLLAAPRIPHPPMDIFLSIHFILKNFYSAKETSYSFLLDLYDDEDYKAIIHRAKQRMWFPYFDGLASADNHHQDFKLSKLFPLAEDS
ncbi:MAG: hypothetical protein GQ527_07215 [Bacteroidales bacterium]|nr:hypothetical protein [Bacteroidales bacterium]